MVKMPECELSLFCSWFRQPETKNTIKDKISENSTGVFNKADAGNTAFVLHLIEDYDYRVWGATVL